MNDIKLPEDIQSMLREPYAICFAYMDTSNPSRKANEQVSKLEQAIAAMPNFPIRQIFRIEPYANAFAQEWLYSQPQLQFYNSEGHLTSLASYGTLVWFKQSSIVHVERNVSERGLSELVETACKVFGYQKS